MLTSAETMEKIMKKLNDKEKCIAIFSINFAHRILYIYIYIYIYNNINILGTYLVLFVIHDILYGFFGI